MQGTRDFFVSQGYLEVDTPILSPAVIPEAHIDPVAAPPFFLQASPELYMKRLLAQGAERIFQICKCFRQGERSCRHLPELTMLEWYGAGHTYADLMNQCQDLLRYIETLPGIKQPLMYQGNRIDLSRPFERLSVARAFELFSSVSPEKAIEQGRFDDILSFDIEPNLGIERPCFLLDYPAPLASLARLHPENPKVAQRFELYIAGIELANGFTELTDAALQRHRFEEENLIRQSLGKAALPLPEKFLSTLGHMPKAAGIALGMDRLVMLFCDAARIEQIVALAPEDM